MSSSRENVATAPINDELEGHSVEDTQGLVVGLDQIERRKRWRRGLVLLVTFFLVGGSVVSYFFFHEPSVSTDAPEDIASDPRLQSYLVPSDAESCPSWPDDQNNTSTISFQIPSSAGLMLFASRGQGGGGKFHLDHAARGAPRGTISITVTAQFDDRKELELTKACRVANAGRNEYGLLLWAEANRTNKANFNVTVLLPDIQDFGDLTTDLNNFSHEIADFFDLWRPVGFGVVRLKSANAPMSVMALTAESGFFQTSNAQLTAGFMGPYQVIMQTSNAYLRAVVWAFGPGNGAQTDVELRTSNSPIDAFLAMASDYTQTKMKTTIHTTNGGVNVTMARSMQPDGEVFLDVATSNAPVNVFLHPEYEGAYNIRTTVTEAQLMWDPNLRDPTGKGRNRTLLEEHGAQTWKKGRMFWGQEQTFDGSVRVRSSVEPVRLYSNLETSPRMGAADAFDQLTSNLW